MVNIYWLVVSTMKNMKVNGKDDIPYMKWKLKFMFETTNQCFLFDFWKKCILKFFANTRLFQHLQMAFITCST